MTKKPWLAIVVRRPDFIFIIGSLASRRSHALHLTRSAQTQKLLASICIPINILRQMKIELEVCEF